MTKIQMTKTKQMTSGGRLFLFEILSFELLLFGILKI